jgi:hypothetical protein
MDTHMKRSLLQLIGVGIVAVSGLALWGVWSTYQPAQNPDPNHTHADFAVWVDGKQLDFSGQAFMSGLSTDANHDSEIGNRKYLHLHDGVGTVIHRHKPGLLLRDFFETLGVAFRVKDGNNLCIRFPQLPEEICQDEASHVNNWGMIVNGGNSSYFDPAYVFKDEDKIMIYVGDPEPTEEDIRRAWDRMTDDACKYSKTCPWKGEPPTENCIADPTVPCVVN